MNDNISEEMIDSIISTRKKVLSSLAEINKSLIKMNRKALTEGELLEIILDSQNESILSEEPAYDIFIKKLYGGEV